VFRLFFAAAVSLLFAVSANAQATPENAKAPKAAMAQIDAIKGDWISIVEIVTQSGEWLQQSKNRINIASHLGGLLLTEVELERLEGDETSPVLKVDYTYDQYREHYRLSAIDSGWGIMDIYEGGLEDDALVVTNLRSDTSVPLADGRALHFRLTIPVTGDERVMLIDMSTDAGENWRPFFRVTYQRPSD